MKSALDVPAHWSEKLRAASSTASRSLTPRDASSPSARRVSKVASTGASAAPAMEEPSSVMTVPALTMPPNALSSFCSLDTPPLTLLLIRPIGPVMLSTIFIIRDNLNTLSRLTDRAHLRAGGRYGAALYPARLLSCVCLASRSFTAEYLGDRAGDDVLFQLLDIAGLRNVLQKLPNLRFLRVKAL